MSRDQALAAVREYLGEAEGTEDRESRIRELSAVLHEHSVGAKHPVGRVQWVPRELVMANDYNPNSVAHKEMELLRTSITEDGYTQPIVAIWDPKAAGDGRYVVVDGFHRFTSQRYPEIRESTSGYLPVVVLDKPIEDRMASTVRHNRARGKHSINGMSSIVFGMLQEGQTDEQICTKLGLEAEELARLKHITGYSKLYQDQAFSKVVITKSQAEHKAEYAKAHPDEKVPRF